MATVTWIKENPGVYARLAESCQEIEETIGTRSTGSFVRTGSMFKYFFRDSPPASYTEAMECDRNAFAKFWEKMIKTGIFLPPSQFETNFLSTAHGAEEIGLISRAYQTCLS